MIFSCKFYLVLFVLCKFEGHQSIIEVVCHFHTSFDLKRQRQYNSSFYYLEVKQQFFLIFEYYRYTPFFSMTFRSYNKA